VPLSLCPLCPAAQTLNILTGDLDATSGDARLDHASIKTDKQHVYARLGFCPQSGGLMENLTGREHVRLYARIKGIDVSEVDRVVDRYLTALLLTEHADKLVEKYSGGNMRKLSLAVSMIGSPRIVLLDEPSSGPSEYPLLQRRSCVSLH
jgi:ABC-type multidrug transport system ATPase subunit